MAENINTVFATGNVEVWVADTTAAMPTYLDQTGNTVTFDGEWTQINYLEDAGVEVNITYETIEAKVIGNRTIKRDIRGKEASIKLSTKENTIANLIYGLGAGTETTVAASSGVIGSSAITIGSGTMNDLQVIVKHDTDDFFRLYHLNTVTASANVTHTLDEQYSITAIEFMAMERTNNNLGSVIEKTADPTV